jgi:hypothetical protein
LRVSKDTRGPRWSDLSTSNRTVFPAKDRYPRGPGAVLWAAATVNGNFYDVTEFKVSYSYFVLR